jgi:hypothetical protein
MKAVAVFRSHTSPVVAAAFLANGTQTLSGDRELNTLPWKIDRYLAAEAGSGSPATIPYAKD